uniref:Uncharacterized protein n=1 Tax=Glossina palpalis gambiensis TaxID=67801 RepID=A0A1B0BKR6_9MUSC
KNPSQRNCIGNLQYICIENQPSKSYIVIEVQQSYIHYIRLSVACDVGGVVCVCVFEYITSEIKKPTRNIVNSQHFPVIDEISSGVILLNGFSGTLEVETEQELLNGTFLIRFHNVSIRVNGNTYTSKEIPTYKALPSILQLMPEEKERKRLVSLQMLDELQINNTKLISYLQTESVVHQYSTWGFVIGIAIVIIILAHIFSWILKSSETMDQSITKCSFTANGQIFAYAVGYDPSKGHE